MSFEIGRIIIIGGNICAGKSFVTKRLGYEEFVEPSADNNPWLAKFYADPKRYAEVVQNYILRERFKLLLKALSMVLMGFDVFVDRQVWDDAVFVTKNYEDGNYSDEGYRQYFEMRDFLIKELNFPSAFVYLDVSVDECLRRNKQMRQNACESGLTADYLQGLEEGYEKIRREAQSKGIPWIVLDWNAFGQPEEIVHAISKVKRYTSDAIWVNKIHDQDWVKMMMEKLDAFYESAVKKIDTKISSDSNNSMQKQAKAFSDSSNLVLAQC